MLRHRPRRGMTPANRSPGAPKAAVRHPVLRLPLVILALAAALAFLMSGSVNTADAQQTSQALVSNIEQQDQAGINTSSREVAQDFTTGGNPGGYVLHSVDIKMFASGANPPAVKVRHGSPDGREVATLTAPSDWRADSSDILTWRFTAVGGVKLEPTETYWIVLSGGPSNNWAHASNFSESGLEGWSIGGRAQGREIGGSSFRNATRNLPMSLRLNGELTPPVVLVSNVGQTQNTLGSKLENNDVAQSFATGPNPAGYVLTSLELRLHTDAAPVAPTVKLVSGSATGTEVATLSLEGALGASTTANYPFAPSETLVLAPSTDYWVVAEGGDADWMDTTSPAQDATSASGWSIADRGATRPSAQTGNFTPFPGSFSPMIQVNGAAIPEVVLVTNFGQTQLQGINLPSAGAAPNIYDQAAAQAFTTGANDDGYTLTSIELRLVYDGSDTLPTVTLRSGSEAGTPLATLTAPTTTTHSSSEQDIVFSPPKPVLLDGNTEYWVVAEGGNVVIRQSSSSNEDAGAASGWSIADNYRNRSRNSTSFFTLANPVKIQVKGGIVVPPNVPATGKPEILAVNDVFRVPAELYANFDDVADSNGKTNLADTATYVWKRYNAAGTTVEDANIGADAYYTLTADDVGKTIRVEVTFVDDDGYTEDLDLSAPTEVVTAAATDCAAPAYIGGAVQLWTATVGIAKVSSGTQSNHFAYYGNVVDRTTAIGIPFDIGSAYTVTNAQNIQDLQTAALELTLAGSSEISAANRRQLALHVCDQPFRFDDAAYTFLSFGPLSRFLWTLPVTNPPIDWSTHAQRTLYISRDQVAPTVDSATATGAQLTVTFNEELGEAASLANGAFMVKKTPSGGSETTLTLAGAPSISGKTVTLTLDAASSISNTDTAIKVTYTKPDTGTDNKLIDGFGNEVATFANQEVTFKSEGGPTISGRFAVGETLTVDTTTITDAEGLTSASYGYQWMRVDTSGMATDITGATNSTYTVASGDAGNRLRVTVSFTDDASNAETRTAATSYIPFENRTLISNFGGAVGGSGVTTNGVSSAFTAGESGAGYRITSVTTRLENLRRASPDTFVAGVYTANASGEPVSPEIVRLNNPSSLPAFVDRTFTAPQSAPIDGGTRYALVLWNPDGTSSCQISSTTASSGSLPGSSFSNQLEGLESSPTTLSPLGSVGNPCRMHIRGYQVTNNVPLLTSLDITSNPGASGFYLTGDTIEITATLSEAVTLDPGSTPALPITIGDNTRQATYSSSDSTTTKWVFHYTVTSDDRDDDGLSIEQHALRALAAADLSHNAIDNDPAALVNPRAVVESVRVTSRPAAPNWYGPGETIQITARFSIPVRVTGDPRFRFNISTPSGTEQADFVRVEDDRNVIFEYLIGTTEEDTDGIWIPRSQDSFNLDSDDAIVADYDSRDAVLDHDEIGTRGTHRISQSPRFVRLDITSDPAHGSSSDTYGLGNKIEFTLTFNQPVTVTGDPEFQFNISVTTAGAPDQTAHERASYTRGSGTSRLVFSYTVLSGDMDTDGIWIGNSTDTLQLDSDDAIEGTDNNLALVHSHSQFGTQSGHKVDAGITPTANTAATGAPTITAPDGYRVPAELGVDLSGIADTNGKTGIADNATYNWQRFSADGTTLEDDAIGWGSTYRLTDADAGSTIKVQVYFTDDDGHSEGPRTSAATSLITAVLVSNLDQAISLRYNLVDDAANAQEFMTGADPEGYTLTSLELRLLYESGDTLPSVTLRRGSRTATPLATFTAPAATSTSSSDQDIEFTPPSEVSLAPNTKYWVVIEGGGVQVRQTSSSDEDDGSASGWEIADESWGRPATGSSNFILKLDAVQFRVNGYFGRDPNVAATGEVAIWAPNAVFRVPAELFVNFTDVADSNGKTNISDSATYVWKRYAANGTTLEDANIGTGASYTLTADDVGKTIRVDVSFVDDAGYTEDLDLSDATEEITAAAACAAPTYVGGATQLWTGRVAVGRIVFPVGSLHGYGPTIGSLDVPSFTADSTYTIRAIDITSTGSLGFQSKGTWPCLSPRSCSSRCTSATSPWHSGTRAKLLRLTRVQNQCPTIGQQPGSTGRPTPGARSTSAVTRWPRRSSLRRSTARRWSSPSTRSWAKPHRWSTARSRSRRPRAGPSPRSRCPAPPPSPARRSR